MRVNSIMMMVMKKMTMTIMMTVDVIMSIPIWTQINSNLLALLIKWGAHYSEVIAKYLINHLRVFNEMFRK